MTGKSISLKTGKVEKNVQKPFRFMNLPPEIRVIIYRLAVVNQSKSCWVSDYYTLVPPAIAQVSKQIRTEVLPVFYGENSFRIDMDIDVLEYDEYGAPVKQDDDTKLEDFLQMCSCMADTGGLGYIKSLTLSYSEPVWEDMSNYLFGFDLVGTDKGKRKPGRVGDNDLDWTDKREVVKAVMTCVQQTVGKEYLRELRTHVPVSNIIRVLFSLASHCHYANRYVEFWWDYGH
ncbi:hypothetical protein ZTR_03619 [Talaromyces verruculosus]|nr:hypothetical protein ZTR_03619 [Talaromyces verruculosus]